MLILNLFICFLILLFRPLCVYIYFYVNSMLKHTMYTYMCTYAANSRHPNNILVVIGGKCFHMFQKNICPFSFSVHAPVEQMGSLHPISGTKVVKSQHVVQEEAWKVNLFMALTGILSRVQQVWRQSEPIGSKVGIIALALDIQFRDAWTIARWCCPYPSQPCHFTHTHKM